MKQFERLFSPGLFSFAKNVFAPVIVFMFLYGLGMANLFIIMLVERSPAAEILYNGALAVVIFALPAGIIVYCYRLCARIKSWVQRGLVIYASWVFIAYEMSFLAASALGGIARRDARGGDPFTIFLQYASYAFGLLLWAQILIIPWILISIRVLKKFGEARLFPSQGVKR